MAHDLIFPRLIYKGAPDTLGLGAGHTARCDSEDDLDQKLKEGWRLTRELPAKKDDAPAAKKDDKK